MVYGGELFPTVNAYDTFQCLSAPVFTLELFRGSASAISMGGMIALNFGAKQLFCWSSLKFALPCSHDAAKPGYAVFCCAVLLIPVPLAAIGPVVGELRSFIILLDGTE